MSPDEPFTLVIHEEGMLPIPAELRAVLRLEAGEPLSLELGQASLSLVPLGAFIDSLDEAISIEEQWERVHQHFLSRPLAFMGENGLPIPEDLFRLQTGESVHLQVIRPGNAAELKLFAAHGPAPRS